MSSRITLLLPDADRQLGADQVAVQQMLDIARVHDVEGVLPSPFIRVTPNITGHGETWYHPQGLFVIRTDHYPVLLTNTRCGTCGLAHMDVAHTYLFASWQDFESRAYMRYVHTQIEPTGLASSLGGA
jgi:hypothetical protein